MAQVTHAELLQRALELPVDDRLALVTELLESVEGPEDPERAGAWAAELDRKPEKLSTSNSASSSAGNPASTMACAQSRVLGIALRAR
ncbi:MAG TPA: addiction module protein [Polyangiaceae bacterium]|nr:addiction module protein [Polyangiaceae bacterium]